MNCNQWMKYLESNLPGWKASKTKKNHVKLEHPQAKAPVFTSSTPSDHRTFQNVRKHCKHAMEGRQL